MPTHLEGEPIAAPIRDRVAAAVRSLSAAGATPTLATVRMTDDPAAVRFMELKHEACADLGIRTRATAVPPGAPAERLYGAVREASGAPDVDAVFVQVPLPAGVEEGRVRRLIDPAKDADCFHPANLGRLVASDPRPRVEPATPRAVLRLLDAHDVALAGADVTLVGRTPAIGRPLANMLLRTAPGPDATVTVCHSRTRDLAAKTRGADVVIAAAGTPGLVDGSMLAEGATVVDVGGTRVETADGHELVGDVDYESATAVAGAITPVPGGVGPVTMATLLENVVTLAQRRA